MHPVSDYDDAAAAAPPKRSPLLLHLQRLFMPAAVYEAFANGSEQYRRQPGDRSDSLWLGDVMFPCNSALQNMMFWCFYRLFSCRRLGLGLLRFAVFAVVVHCSWLVALLSLATARVAISALIGSSLTLE